MPISEEDPLMLHVECSREIKCRGIKRSVQCSVSEQKVESTRFRHYNILYHQIG